MLAFKISLNGRLVALAGASDLGVLTVFVTASGRLGPAARPSYAHQEGYQIRLDVGGLTSRGSNYREEFLNWADTKLELGDVVKIEIVEVDAGDRPGVRKPQVEVRSQFAKRPRKGTLTRFGPYQRKRKRGARTIHD